MIGLTQDVKDLSEIPNEWCNKTQRSVATSLEFHMSLVQSSLSKFSPRLAARENWLVIREKPIYNKKKPTCNKKNGTYNKSFKKVRIF